MSPDEERGFVERIFRCLTEVKTEIAEIRTTLKMLPPPPAQPCEHEKLLEQRVQRLERDLARHERDETETQRDWRVALIRLAMSLVGAGLIGALGYLLGRL